MKPWIVGAVDAALFLFGWSAIALAAAPDAQTALLFSACWLLPVSVAVWALGTRQARNILAGRGGLRRSAWEGVCWGAGLGLVAVLLSNAPDALAAGRALEGQPLFSGQTAWFLLDGWPLYLVAGVLGGACGGVLWCQCVAAA
ncbi:hypothetical protein [Metapseudomonas otitidis]|uniref:hypothetical protein n=1 Tax=Metapseudomonas otitidis TaxID=319939 RepID=UPI0013F69483|nr:hypothetical protein [Pseudomonas otitidis]